MASDLPLKTTFTWGDGVIVLMNAPEIYRPGTEGYICGIRIVNTDKLKTLFDCQIGTELYLVEYMDGSDQEIPVQFLAHNPRKSDL